MDELLRSDLYPSSPTLPLSLVPVTVTKVKEHIRRLNNSRAIGVDGIPVVFWKQCLNELAGRSPACSTSP